jgi:dinuclear metal center YbgI/SA1388 family protein
VSDGRQAGEAARGVVRLDDLVAYLDGYLAAAEVPDYGPNGLQVEGRAEVRRLVTGVSACQELFARAVERGADAVLVHHGIFWDGMPYVLTGVQRRRVGALLAADLSLLAYHLPLDAHAEVGNNALAARRLGLVDLAPFATHRGVAIGWQGRFAEPLPFAAFVRRCGDLYGQEPLAFGAADRPVVRVGIVSGGAQKELHQAIAAGLMNVARESGVGYVAAGHYATERLGVQALGEHLATRFGLAVEFVDVPNPV